MKFVRLTANEGETRWVNLDRVTRATYAHDSAGVPLLVVLFDGGATETLRIHGDNPLDAAAIELLTTKFDSLSDAEEPILSK